MHRVRIDLTHEGVDSLKELDYVAFGQRIQAVRKARGVSQEALCNLTNLSQSHVSHIEWGKTKPSFSTVLAIANALGTTIDSFLPNDNSSSINAYDKDFKELLEDCTDEERKFLLETAMQLKTILRRTVKSAK